ncbi:unnamed protein product [Rangifer tarandus platyrhynchus]|uniref:Uncharacterized protein n=2 Tax=Rangifer tarandus platyrhynchus TaxID=3082113 RepID=A0ACB0DZF6_RANTA|nr:unnamed protein product [Rangifer tarandus platyrhynchus]CAI9693631.1 unnamed protein product [Rangifer tarandus platyrhynchus]
MGGAVKRLLAPPAASFRGPRASPKRAASILGAAPPGPGRAAATSWARVLAPSRACTQGATPAHLPSSALRHPPALGPGLPAPTCSAADTPPLPAPHPGPAPLPSPSELPLE